jgi:hypothetical protein
MTPGMVNGTLHNQEMSGFVATDKPVVDAIFTHVLQLPERDFLVLEPSIGEGDLAAPLAAIPQAVVYGWEISRERAVKAQERLPAATVITAPLEHVRAEFLPPTTKGTKPRKALQDGWSLVLTNPPYINEDGTRAEKRFIEEAGKGMREGAILVAFIPARSAITTSLVRHLSMWYDHLQAWQTPPEIFAQYTQIVVCGVRRGAPRDLTVDRITYELVRGWAYKEDPKNPEKCPWRQGVPLPQLPTGPLARRYAVPPGSGLLPEITILQADEASVVEALQHAGAHLSERWEAATTWQPQQATLGRPLMPLAGPTHLVSLLIAAGVIDGQPLCGPDGHTYLFSTSIGTRWVPTQIDDDQRKQGIIDIKTQQDNPCLTVLNVTTGELQHFQSEDVYAFLAPWMGLLAERVLAQFQPIYRLDPEPWQVEAVSTVCTDRQLPGSRYPGLALPQQHIAYATHRTLELNGRVLLNGEAGTGKTRTMIAVWRMLAEEWHNWTGIKPGQRQPRWMRRLKKAWKANPLTQGRAPKALPMLVSAPKRNEDTWTKELDRAWPEAEYLKIGTYQDVQRWMARCAVSTAPVVVAIFPQSLTRAFGRAWQPAVIERKRLVDVPELEPEEALLPELEEERDESTSILLGYRFIATGQLLTKQVERSTFYCPDCGALQEALPNSLSRRRSQEQEQTLSDPDDLAAITSRTWFLEKQQRCCACDVPLWTDAMRESTLAKYTQAPFVAWARAAEALLPDLAAAEQALEATWAAIASNTDPLAADPLREQHAAQEAALAAARAEVSPPLAGKRRMARLTTDGRREVTAPASYAPYDYLFRWYRGCVANAVIDESHNARGRATDIAHSVHQAQLASQTYVYASGTHYTGRIDEVFHYAFRFDPAIWRSQGIGWEDVARVVKDFGVLQTITKERESASRRGSGKTDISVSVIPAPGISAKFIPHMLPRTLFLLIDHLGAFMPPMVEIPVLVPLADEVLEEQLQAARERVRGAAEGAQQARETLTQLTKDPQATDQARSQAALVWHAAQEALDRAQRALTGTEVWVENRNLEQHYHTMASTLDQAAMKGCSAARMGKHTLGLLWPILPYWRDPQFTINQTRRGDWGDVEQTELVYTAPTLSPDHLYPLERKLQEIVAQELAEDRPTMVYYCQNGTRDTAQRLRDVLSDFDPWVLPNSVKAQDREDAIKDAVAAGARLLLVPYLRVLEGLNLQEIKTICWFEMPENLVNYDQACRRIWRLGQDTECRYFLLAYKHTAAHGQLVRIGQRSGGASVFTGKPPQRALERYVGADKTTVAKLSASVAALQQGPVPDSAEEADLALAFEQRQRERARALKQGATWLGLTEDHLPALLEAVWVDRVLPAPAVPTPVLEQSVVDQPPPVAAPTPMRPVQPAPSVEQEPRGDLFSWMTTVMPSKTRTPTRRGRGATTRQHLHPSTPLPFDPLAEATTPATTEPRTASADEAGILAQLSLF